MFLYVQSKIAALTEVECKLVVARIWEKHKGVWRKEGLIATGVKLDRINTILLPNSIAIIDNSYLNISKYPIERILNVYKTKLRTIWSERCQ